MAESSEAASAFLAEVGVTYAQYIDPEAELGVELGVVSMPTTVVIDGDGNITTRHEGVMSQDELDAAIDGALGG